MVEEEIESSMAPVQRYQEEPGDGYRYVLLVIGPLLEDTECGELGAVSAGGFLVVSSMSGRSYLFQGNGEPLHWRYVQEKLGGTEQVARQQTKMLGKLLHRPVIT